jgi:hypothetical protein
MSEAGHHNVSLPTGDTGERHYDAGQKKCCPSAGRQHEVYTPGYSPGHGLSHDLD